MAAIKIYVPVYMVGENGKKAFQFAALTGTITNAKVPEGAPMVSSRVMTTTPEGARQPPEPEPGP